MIEPICIIAFFGAVGFLVWTVLLSSDDNYWSIATALACVGCIIVCGLYIPKKGMPHTISDVKTVQIDTVVTTYKNVSDTTYVIHYTI